MGPPTCTGDLFWEAAWSTDYGDYCGYPTSSGQSMSLYTKPVPHAPGNPQSPVVVNPQVPVSVNPETPVSALDWSLKDWYHVHYYQLGIFLVSLSVVLCVVNLCMTMTRPRRKGKLYAPVKYMESDMESDV